MAQGHSARVVGLGKVDPIFSRIRLEAEETVRNEPELAGFLIASVLNHETLESAIVHRVAARLDHPDVGGHLIRQTSMPILSVGLACGFVSASHFSKCYSEYFKRTPSEERNGMRGERKVAVEGDA